MRVRQGGGSGRGRARALGGGSGPGWHTAAKEVERSRKGYTSSPCPLGLVARATAGAEVVAFETDEGVVANGLFEGIEEMEEALVERRRPGVLDRTETIKGLTD